MVVFLYVFNSICIASLEGIILWYRSLFLSLDTRKNNCHKARCRSFRHRKSFRYLVVSEVGSRARGGVRPRHIRLFQDKTFSITVNSSPAEENTRLLSLISYGSKLPSLILMNLTNHCNIVYIYKKYKNIRTCMLHVRPCVQVYSDWWW